MIIEVRKRTSWSTPHPLPNSPEQQPQRAVSITELLLLLDQQPTLLQTMAVIASVSINSARASSSALPSPSAGKTSTITPFRLGIASLLVLLALFVASHRLPPSPGNSVPSNQLPLSQFSSEFAEHADSRPLRTRSLHQSHGTDPISSKISSRISSENSPAEGPAIPRQKAPSKPSRLDWPRASRSQWRARRGSGVEVLAEMTGKETGGAAAFSGAGGARKPQPEWRGEGKEDAEGRRVAGAERKAEEANRGEGDGERREGKTVEEERGREGAAEWSGDEGNGRGKRARGRGGVNRSGGVWVRDWWAEEWGDDSGLGDDSEEEWEREGWERGEGETRGEFEGHGVGESEKNGQQDGRRGGGRSSSGGRRRDLVEEGWVEGPDESANLAFSWVNEAGRQEDLISPAAKRYRWVWPTRQQGSSWRMPFARPTSVDIANTRSCAKLLPPSAYTGLSTTITGENASEDQLRALLATAGAAAAAGGSGNASAAGAAAAGERWLVYVPRHGLGNSLRGFSSALLFAMLSGRRFLRWHGGPHGRVLDRLCDAFDCATDQLITTSLSLPLSLLEDHDLLLHSLSDPSPVLSVFTGAFFDKFWRGDKRVYRCVLAAFRCATIWCVHAQTLALLLPNGPSVRLERELDKGLWSIRPLVLQPEGGEGAGVGGGRVGMGEEEEHWEMEKVPPGQAMRMQFDMALHVRGRPSKVELVCMNGDPSCMQQQQQQQQQQQEQQEREQQELVASLLRPSRWHCIVRLAQFLRMKKAAALLAAAAPADGAGGGYATASASAAAEEAGGTAAAAATGAGTSSTTSAAPAVSPSDQSLPASSPHAAPPTLSPTSVPLAPSPIDPAISSASNSSSTTSRSTSSSSAGRRRRLEEEWTVEESMRIAAITTTTTTTTIITSPTSPLPPAAAPAPPPFSPPLPLLTIFIATDTDEVRPAMVKFLRPFGRVFFSNAPAIHLSKSRSQGSHLSTLGDFLMLSKASVVVSFTRYISTFAMFAAMLGNGTLVAQPESESNCRFVVEHLAQMPPDLT
ncbi:unnamed protein product [Closterium sp. NIES-53]